MNESIKLFVVIVFSLLLVQLIGSGCGPPGLREDKDSKECNFCTKSCPGLTICTIELENGEELKTCCARCAVRLIKERFPSDETPVSATARDIATGKTLDLKESFFVVGGDQILCCYPPAIPFDSSKRALDYQKEHGGLIYGWEDLYDVLWRRKGGESGR